MAESPSNAQIRRYYKALPKPARRNLRVKSTSGRGWCLDHDRALGGSVPSIGPWHDRGSLLDEIGVFFGSAIGLAAGGGRASGCF